MLARTGRSFVPRQAAEPTVQQALGLAPVQKQVEFDRPTGTDVGRCSIKEIERRAS